MRKLIVTNIKSILKEANMYDEVVDILKTIIVSPNTNHYAVALYYDKDGTVRNDVDAGSVKLEAAILLLCIEDMINYEQQNIIYLSALSVYLDDMTNTLLHNYAVSLTHKEEPTIGIDTIRCFSIINARPHIQLVARDLVQRTYAQTL